MNIPPLRFYNCDADVFCRAFYNLCKKTLVIEELRGDIVIIDQHLELDAENPFWKILDDIEEHGSITAYLQGREWKWGTVPDNAAKFEVTYAENNTKSFRPRR